MSSNLKSSGYLPSKTMYPNGSKQTKSIVITRGAGVMLKNRTILLIEKL